MLLTSSLLRRCTLSRRPKKNRGAVSSGIVGPGEPFLPLSGKTNIRSRRKVTRHDENAHARPLLAPRRLAERKYYFYTALSYFPSRSPLSFSLSLSSFPTQRSRALLFTAAVPPLELPLGITSKGLEITVSSCVRYLDTEGRECNPFVRDSCLRGLDLSKLTGFIL